ncbi:hypothetical protein [Aureispira sp. CCB-E]|uniref:hypothetical protein n=1 Tax=Aureispira sp. CCB-E TaxID=3051121 RepID=UPI00286840C9|nr:hypothetical protein [Aureispira sp. CCB-E]WMX17084.1 hypothetical protein QP953_11940 [Aureispira sp. CCB-E]
MTSTDSIIEAILNFILNKKIPGNSELERLFDKTKKIVIKKAIGNIENQNFKKVVEIRSKKDIESLKELFKIYTNISEKALYHNEYSFSFIKRFGFKEKIYLDKNGGIVKKNWNPDSVRLIYAKELKNWLKKKENSINRL